MIFFVAVVFLAAQVAVARSDGTILKRNGHAIRWPEKISIPILIQHGSADPSVDPLQSIQMATRLQELKDGHVLTKNRELRDGAIIGWFRTHMAASSDTPSK